MKINELIYNSEVKVLCGDIDVDIQSIEIDSRRVKEDSMFVCIKGLNVDGHNYIDKAIENGAKCIVVSDDNSDFVTDKIARYNEYEKFNVCVIKVSNTREALSIFASLLYDEPTNEFGLIGVTGTNGKTSTTYFIEQLLRALDKKTGVIGTTGALINGEQIEFSFDTSTTPDAHHLQSVFNIMRNENCESVVMEVTSQGLDQKRVFGSKFDVAVFTNLTQDHLDYHNTMEQYFEAKLSLFKQASKSVVNIDDEYGQRIANMFDNVLTVSLEKNADINVSNIKYTGAGSNFDITYKGVIKNVKINTPGKFTVYNVLCAIGALIQSGIEFDTVINTLPMIKGVRGRIQSVENNRGISILVDYAHTPDGLVNIINSVKEFTKGRVITVFGCGGDRDRTKRPIMAEITSRLSDVTIVTSDNPRTENPDEIVKEVSTGLNKDKEYHIIVDRKDAIFKAIEMAKENDSVIVAGKGHEDYQIIGTTKIHFDDVEVCQEAIEKL